jgi:thiosulfate/3-mercaptopyruvate sulfurtransferase
VTERAAAVLVTAEELRAAVEPPVLLDVRWALGDDRGHDHYLEGHLPGAVFVDLDTELADPPSAHAGRHPLPSLQRLQECARRWGISEGNAVVVYDASGGTAAARAWWLLRWAGLADVRLLDGGLAAWERAGGELERGEVVPEPGNVTLPGGGLPTLDPDEAAALPRGGGVLLDARAAERYRGEVEPVDPRAGHVPGALSAPTTGNLAPDGTFLPAAVLSDRFAALGVRPGAAVGVYCGSGVTAAHEVAALAVAGIDAALWPGSWSQWSADPDRPAATGPDPG